MHQQPPPLPPPAQAAQRIGPVDASEGFGGALINVDQQKQLGFGGGFQSAMSAQSAPEQLMMRQFPPVSGAPGGAVLTGPPMGVPPPGQPGSPAMSVTSGSSTIVSTATLVGSQGSQDSGLGAPLLRPAEPKFAFGDINTTSLNGIVPHITIDPRLTLFKEHPDLIQLVKISIEKSIQGGSKRALFIKF